VLVRVVVKAGTRCPAIQSNAGRRAMVRRVPVPAGMQPVCEAELPSGVTRAAVNGQELALPRTKADNIVVIGDTGCRIKGDRVQDCNDPAKWPLQRVSTRAAREKPDLVIHVGDYLYREDQCPQDLRHLCGTGPSGDRWDTWAADFFTPAAKLLAAAPWAFSRGNHEDCARSWKGWFYYLDPRPWSGGGCLEYSEPYQIAYGGLDLFMLDSASSKGKRTDGEVARYAEQLKKIHGSDVWLVDHHPFWDLRPAGKGKAAEPAPGPLAAAWDRAEVSKVSLVVSGHTHMFELLTSAGHRAPQLIAGDGGTNLQEADPTQVDGVVTKGVGVSGTSWREFGYTFMQRTKSGWDVEVKAPLTGTIAFCKIEREDASCKAASARSSR
ncbi:MAG: metallophosphoesterase, partial [Acidobacteriaceae bacterium]|nr:metallophosphoesterase [Acidobacteriaceae bacterium]